LILILLETSKYNNTVSITPLHSFSVFLMYLIIDVTKTQQLNLINRKNNCLTIMLYNYHQQFKMEKSGYDQKLRKNYSINTVYYKDGVYQLLDNFWLITRISVSKYRDHLSRTRKQHFWLMKCYHFLELMNAVKNSCHYV